ncbi:MAG TPA: dipeptide ABC transporter ATP-binding protein [Candidatus Hydrogenedentes bacterium]|nr:dipeptide ABC transporter ATP-binding protein [Candidatus Hydrogenedentota bacterium]HOL76948.1 dipeptide ABC transporter ATP-binding protein [Candidatus Hydrogenedentota bacterium]HPO86663.1 dipeptide ABC transporter ATP-binding protein [Candidatus Hydrogenedentota bacterium]
MNNLVDPHDVLLRVENLKKYFPIYTGVFSRVTGVVKAVDGISFSVQRGKTLSLVGESGCGKTTAGRCILRLIEPTSGTTIFDGISINTLKPHDLRRLRRRMQPVFQDPFGSLNPRMTVYSVLAEILAVHNLVPRNKRRDRIYELLEMVGLSPESADRYPHEFSGGQRQRIGIARALAVEPELIVADEPISALDVSIQAQILNLLMDLQRRLGLTYIFISHDLSVVRHISDHVAVMYLGKIVEIGSAEDIFERAVHPYTKALLAAAPTPDPDRKRTRIILQGDVPSPINPPSGCPFHPRCPDAKDSCKHQDQVLTAVTEEHAAACHIHVPRERHARDEIYAR